MTHRCLGAAALCAAALLLVPANARAIAPAEAPAASASVALDDADARVTAHLLLDPDARPATGPVRAAVAVELPPGWHIYGRDPGETGLPTTVVWSVEEGGRARDLPWPPTERFEALGGAIVSQGWSGRVVLPARLEFPPGAAAHPRVGARVGMLACASQCIPVTLELTRRVGEEGALAAATERALLGAAPAREEPAVGGGAPTLAAGSVGLLASLALAFVGGVLLNLMPCVLPVLGIKAVALAELAHRGRREGLVHGAAYCAGILASMAVLAAGVLALRSAGHAVGWGFQFQEPLFLAGLALALVAFALNLLGVFEVGFDPGALAGVGAQATGARRSFLDGLLAVALATPCSAPFLGTAVGVALASPGPEVVAIFLSVGLGLAAPFVALTAWPGWARLVPRPGAWMMTLRAALGFALLFTAVWLAWILGRVAGADAVVALVATGLGVGVAAWAAGRAQAAGRPVLRALLAPALLLAVLAPNAVGLVGAPPRSPEVDPGASHTDAAWRPERVRELLASGHPVLAYFTADWCITCQVNEAQVLEEPRVRAALERAGVVVLRGDWTRRDPEIRDELARHGRAGVPLTLLYDPSDPSHPKVFPELLRAQRVLAAVARVGRPPGTSSGEARHTVTPRTADANAWEGRIAAVRRSP